MKVFVLGIVLMGILPICQAQEVRTGDLHLQRHSYVESLTQEESHHKSSGLECPIPTGTWLFVDTDTQEMHLCDDGLRIESFPVSVGVGGFSDKGLGSYQTPVGQFDIEFFEHTRYGEVLRVLVPSEKKESRRSAVSVKKNLRRLRKASKINFSDARSWNKNFNVSEMYIRDFGRRYSRDLSQFRSYLVHKYGQVLGMETYYQRVDLIKKDPTLVNWTQGCIAVPGSDALAQVIRFVQHFGQVKLLIDSGEKLREHQSIQVSQNVGLPE